MPDFVREGAKAQALEPTLLGSPSSVILSGETATDARSESATRGKVETVRLVAGTQMLVPRGVCNGFQSVSPGTTQYLYTFDAEWVEGMAGVAVNPLDPALGITWPLPVEGAALSEKDRGLPTLAEALREADRGLDSRH